MEELRRVEIIPVSEKLRRYFGAPSVELDRLLLEVEELESRLLPAPVEECNEQG